MSPVCLIHPFTNLGRCCLASCPRRKIHGDCLSLFFFVLCQEAERAIVKASAEKERRRSSAAAAAAWVPKVLTPSKDSAPNGVANGDGMKTPVKG